MKRKTFIYFYSIMIFLSCSKEDEISPKIKDDITSQLKNQLATAQNVINDYHMEYNLLNISEHEEFSRLFTGNLDSLFSSKIDRLLKSMTEKKKRHLYDCIQQYKINSEMSNNCMDAMEDILAPIANTHNAMVLKAYSLSIDSIFSDQSFSQKIESGECDSFKSGVYTYTIPFENRLTKIFRTTLYEIQVTGSDTSLYNISWQEPCAYYLTHVEKAHDTTLFVQIIDKRNTGYRFVSKTYVKDTLAYSNLGIVE